MIIGFIDSLSAAFSFGALCVIFITWKRGDYKKLKLVIVALLTVNLTYYFFLLLEWYQITLALEKLEDLSGTMIPILWAATLYMFFLQISNRDTIVCEEKFKAIFDQAKCNYMLLKPKPDGDLKIVDANASACRFHGYSQQEIIGKSYSGLCLDLNYSEQVRENLEVTSGKYISSEKIYRHKDGSTFPAEIHLSRIRMNDNVTLILMVENDISEIKESHEKIKELEMYPDQNPAPVMRTNENGVLLYANSSSYELLRSWKASVNRPLPLIWCERIIDVLQKGRAMQYEVKYNDIYISLCLCPLKEINRVNIYGYDITDLKDAEELLKRNESLLDEVSKIALVGGWEIDVKTGKAKWTKATYDIVEITPGEHVPNINEHINYYLPEYHAMVHNSINQLLEKNIPFDYTAKFKTAKGNIKWCHAIGRGIIKDGKCVKIYGTFQDITKQKQVEEELNKHRKHLEELVNERTSELNAMVKLMSGRETRMAELKKVVKTLSEQLEGAGMKPETSDLSLERSDHQISEESGDPPQAL